MRIRIAPGALSWARRGAAVGVVISLALAFAPWASAAQEEFQPSPTGYHSQTQDPLVDFAEIYGEFMCNEPAPPQLMDRACLDPYQVTGGAPVWVRQDNYVYVAQFAGNDDSWGVVGTSAMFGIPFNSVITAITFDFQVETGGSAGTFGMEEKDSGVMICLATTGFAGGDNGSWETRPETDCAVQAIPTYVSTVENIITFTADLMPLAAAWAEGRENLGFVMRPGRDAPDNFQLAIRSPGVSPDGMRLRVTYEPGPEEDLDTGFVGGVFGFQDTFTTPEFTEGFPGIPGTPPTFSVAEDPPQAAGPIGRRPFGDPQWRWWMFIGIPLGLALLAAMAHGVGAPAEATVAQRMGPVSRLMQRPTPVEQGA